MTININELIEKLILEGLIAEDLESETIEFKPFPNNKEKLANLLREYAVCFANSKGGQLILGVEDKIRGESAIKGCKSYNLEELNKMIFDGTSPHIEATSIDKISIRGKTLIAITFSKSQHIHATSSGKRFHRVNKECRILYPEDDISVEVSKGGDYSAKYIRGTTINDLDPLEIKRLRRIIEQQKPGSEYLSLNDEQLLASLEIIKKEGNEYRPTIAGLLLVGKELVLKEHLPQNETIFMHFISDTDYDKREDLKTPLLYSVERIAEMIESYNKINTLKMGMFHIEIPSFPPEAYREAILNALTHRSYVANDSVNIRLYDDRLEIGNPGGFPDGINPDNIIYHEPRHRNKLLAEIFQKIGLVNRGGLGVDRIYKILLSYGKQPPIYLAQVDSVALIIKNGSFDDSFAKFVGLKQKEGYNFTLDHLLILFYLRRHREIDRAHASRLCQRSEIHISDTLSQMVNDGLLEKTGTIKARLYRLSKKLYELRGEKVKYIKDRGIDQLRYKELIMNYLKEWGTINNEKCRELLSVNLWKASRVLRQYVNEGLVIPEGKGNNRIYRLKQ
jgi:ATP-dependent DNA helicase RecG